MNSLLGRVFDSAFGEMYIFDAVSFKFLYVSKGVIDNLGYAEAELLQMTPMDIKSNMAGLDYRSLLEARRSGEKNQIVFEGRHSRKNGTSYPVEIRLSYVCSEQPYVFVANVVDISNRTLAVEEEATRNARTARQNAAYSHLTKQQYQGTESKKAILHEVTKSTAIALEIDRVRIWMFDKLLATAVCASLYERDSNVHHSGVEITLTQFPQYFKAITEARVLTAVPACNDPRFSEICGTDLCPHPGTSLMFAPIRIANRLVGVMSCEMVGKERKWFSDEENFVASMADFTALVLGECELVRAKEAAEQSERAKTTFLANMSHELRTPLNAVIGFAQLLSYDQQEPLTEAQRECVDNILKGGWHLLDMITDLLDLSFVENGRLQLSLSGVDIGPILSECMDLVSTQADSRSIRIECSTEGCDEGLVWADPARLRQAILSLLSNAVKYNQIGGMLSITCAPLPDGTIRVLIRDSGKGISAEQLVQLFVPFNRLDASQNAISGVGAGLVLTKRLVEMMGGSIGVESEVGVGTSFWIDLRPFVSNNAAKQTPRLLDEMDCGESVRRKEVILYVEDNPSNVKVVTRALKRSRPDTIVLSAPTAKAGLALAKIYQPDAILLDIGLPDMSGYEVFAAIRRHESIRHTPILGLSSNATPGDVEKGLRTGFQNYLTKPLMLDEFNNALNYALPKRKLN